MQRNLEQTFNEYCQTVKDSNDPQSIMWTLTYCNDTHVLITVELSATKRGVYLRTNSHTGVTITINYRKNSTVIDNESKWNEIKNLDMNFFDYAC